MSDRIQTIVAGVSHPAEDDPTLVAAAELARWTGAALHLVHAFDLPALFAPPELGYVPPDWASGMADSRRALLQAAAARVPGAESAHCHAVPGPAAPAILEAARGAGATLLVVGAARPGRLFAAFLGTTAQRVLRGAEHPVLVVRRAVHRPLRRVLLATDLSPASAAAHEQGLDTAAALFGPPAAARSLLVLPYLFVPSPLPHEAMERAALDQVTTYLRERRPRPFSVERRVRIGVPGDEIAAEAQGWDADLVVVGTHARGWAERLLLGSVAEATVREAPCNVLAVPPRLAALEARERQANAVGAGVPAPAPCVPA